MKKSVISLLLISLLTWSCSKTDDVTTGYVEPEYPNADVIVEPTVESIGSYFQYKKYAIEGIDFTNTKGIIILSHGDGGDINDPVLNDQCKVLAQQHYVAVTTSYQAPTGTVEQINFRYENDIWSVILQLTGEYGLPFSKVIVGGLSRGGNLAYNHALPGQGANITNVLAGVILECAGGDEWKGSAMLFPTAFMSNQTDDVMGMEDATNFKNGLQNNINPGVAAKSECLIIPGTGHCGSANQYKAFVFRKVTEWLP